jgi:beta-galactosidase
MSLQRYAASEAFQPKSELSAEALEKLFTPAIAGLMQRLGAKVIGTDSQAPDYEAANVIDGDPQTIWHTPWEDPAPGFPHYLVIEFPAPIELRGLKVLPRQDMSNGWIKGYEVFASDDGKNWSSPVTKGELAASGDLQDIQFGRQVKAKYLKFVALSSFEKKPFASLAELEVILAGRHKPAK